MQILTASYDGSDGFKPHYIQDGVPLLVTTLEYDFPSNYTWHYCDFAPSTSTHHSKMMMVFFKEKVLLQLDLNWNLNRSRDFSIFLIHHKVPTPPQAAWIEPKVSLKILFYTNPRCYSKVALTHFRWTSNELGSQRPLFAQFIAHFGPNSFAVRALCASNFNLLLRFVSLYSSKAAKWDSSRDFAMTSLSQLRIYNERCDNS